MKEFFVYTGMRFAIFLACFAVVSGIWAMVADMSVDQLFLSAIVALLISGVLSLRLLNPQRAAFAQRVEARAARASAAFEERRAREDADDDSRFVEDVTDHSDRADGTDASDTQR